MIVMTIGCEDYLDVNDSPNNTTGSSPSLTLPVAQQYLVGLNATSMNYLGNYIMGSYSTPSNWSANADLFRYNVTTSFYSTIFETSFGPVFRNFTYVSEYEDGVSDYSSFKTISKTLTAFQYQYLVDLYGDVPYTEANQRSENTTPAYDDAETVYKAQIDALTEAANEAINTPIIAVNPGTSDIIFNGDMNLWAQFANTIKLRMLIRLSNTGQDTYIKDQIALINSNGAGYIASTVFANPGYSDATDKQTPIYGFLGYAPNAGSLTNANDYTVASEYMINQLTNNNDERIGRLFKLSAADNAYKGVEQNTSLPGSGFTSNELSHVGEGILIAPDADQPIMLFSESLFLQAEAIERGYITTGSSQAMFESAIEASFNELGVTDATTEAQTYYAQPINNVSWDASSNKIEAIITQKSFALCGTNAIESWIELTRTGYPSNIPTAIDSDGVRPVRLLYPASEVSRNSENTPNQTSSDAFNSNPFWK